MDKFKLPSGIKTIGYARAIRWIGWGFAESLIPVYLFSVSKSFSETGLLGSVVDIVCLLTLPLAGVWADKVPGRKLILISLLLYPFVGIGYFLAGIGFPVIFIIVARVCNGFCWAIENIGVSTYFRRVSKPAAIGSSFGFVDTVSHVGWIAAAVMGMFFAGIVPIHVLLLAVAPFALVAVLIARRAPVDAVVSSKRSDIPILKTYIATLTAWRQWNSKLRFIANLVLFSELVSSLIGFFVPIDAFIDGAGLSRVVLLAVVGAVPAAFGFVIGRIADKCDKPRLIGIGLVGVALIAYGLAVVPQLWFKMVASFLLGFIVELFDIIQHSLVTTLGPASSYGQRGSVFESIQSLGDVVSPILLGVALDILGFKDVAFAVAALALLLCFVGVLRTFVTDELSGQTVCNAKPMAQGIEQ
jgi:MFS family permease